MIVPVSALGSEWTLGGIGGLGSAAHGTPAADAVPTGSGSFGNTLTDAINSLDQSQTVADSAAQGLATGTLTDPTQAITAVENASLDMDFASQISNKVVTDANTIFQTQM